MTKLLSNVCRAGLQAGPGVLISLLVPKCPLCLAVLLTSFGLGSTLASKLAPWLHTAWLGIGCAAIFVPLGWRFYRRRAACACRARKRTLPS